MRYLQIIARVLIVLPGLIRMADEMIPGEQKGLEKLAVVLDTLKDLIPEVKELPQDKVQTLVSKFIAKQKEVSKQIEAAQPA